MTFEMMAEGFLFLKSVGSRYPLGTIYFKITFH